MIILCLISVTLVYLLDGILDFLYYTLPNKLFYALFYLYPLYILVMQNYSLVTNYGLFLIFVVLGFIAFSLSLFEAGDAKLLAVSTLWVGWDHLFVFLLIMALLGGLMGLCYVYFDFYIHQLTKSGRQLIQGKPFLRKSIHVFVTHFETREADIIQMQERRLIPYGIAISLATLSILWGVT